MYIQEVIIFLEQRSLIYYLTESDSVLINALVFRVSLSIILSEVAQVLVLQPSSWKDLQLTIQRRPRLNLPSTHL